MKDGDALVLFSGGQDSTTCLAWALDRYDRVETIGFDYGQRHRIELEVRPRVLQSVRSGFPSWATRLGPDHIVDLSVLGQLSETSLTLDVEIVVPDEGLPNTFIPGRNLLFLTFAATVAYRHQIKHIVTGVCETDYSGYPDCRDDTIKAVQLALNLGMERRFVLHTPLMWIDKAATWRLARDLGGDNLVNLILDSTHTCYVGQRGLRHPWGFGCGECPACVLRADGYRRFRAEETSNIPKETQYG
jgi:7-cyano-7-deazaguanine synthase